MASVVPASVVVASVVVASVVLEYVVVASVVEPYVLGASVEAANDIVGLLGASFVDTCSVLAYQGGKASLEHHQDLQEPYCLASSAGVPSSVVYQVPLAYLAVAQQPQGTLALGTDQGQGVSRSVAGALVTFFEVHGPKVAVHPESRSQAQGWGAENHWFEGAGGPD